MNRDGTIDMVFVTCSAVSSTTGIGSDCYINIAYNRQLPLCSSPTSTSTNNGRKICRQPDQLCYADPNFRFDLGQRPDNDVRLLVFLYGSPANPSSKAFVRFPVTDAYSKSSLLVLDTRSSPPVALPIRLGDANLDGYPDLLFVTAADPHGGLLGIGQSTEQIPRLLLSTACAAGVITCNARGNKLVGWKPVKKGAEPLTAVVDAANAAFIDIDEDVSELLELW